MQTPIQEATTEEGNDSLLDEAADFQQTSKTAKNLTPQEHELVKLLYNEYREIQVRLREKLQETYGIKDLDRIKHQLLVLRTSKVQLGHLIRIIRSQEYQRVSEDFRELESLKKLPVFNLIKDELFQLREKKGSPKQTIDTKTLTTLKILKGGYKNVEYGHV